MTQTAVGLVADTLGHATDGHGRFWATPAHALLRAQDARIPVDLDHSGHKRGHVVHLEKDRAGNVWAVAEIDDTVRPEISVRVGHDLVALEHDLYWSPTRIGSPDDGIALVSLALTTRPSRVFARPVTILPGGFGYSRTLPTGWRVDGYQRSLLERALETVRDRRRLPTDAALLIVDEPEPGTAEHRHAPDGWQPPPRRKLEWAAPTPNSILRVG